MTEQRPTRRLILVVGLCALPVCYLLAYGLCVALLAQVCSEQVTGTGRQLRLHVMRSFRPVADPHSAVNAAINGFFTPLRRLEYKWGATDLPADHEYHAWIIEAAMATDNMALPEDYEISIEQHGDGIVPCFEARRPGSADWVTYSSLSGEWRTE